MDKILNNINIMSEIYNYRLFCDDENKNVFSWGITPPIHCPNSEEHTINTDNNSIVGSRFDRLCIISDEKESSAHGGYSIEKTWVRRELNKCVPNYPNSIHINDDNNGFIIKKSGTYSIFVKAPAYKVKSHQCRLVATSIETGVSNEYIGTTEYANKDMTSSMLECNIQIDKETEFYVEHWCEKADVDTNEIPTDVGPSENLGIACGATDVSEIYTYVRILLLS
jgi:hypothetical protein